ncbi:MULTISPECIES: hypothetical protein [unclassified Helicobacter]|uniref:hypothetical protein n=1 Tax=unclassified Helicobacter TaxID=2593540 RepID=UPI00115FC766|nr:MULTISPECIES: hypothetical protein [unclassified Helicobacter]
MIYKACVNDKPAARKYKTRCKQETLLQARIHHKTTQKAHTMTSLQTKPQLTANPHKKRHAP